MLDIHCHILPAVDDGAATLEESLAMAALAKTDGIDHIICTPHVNPDLLLAEQMQRLLLEHKQKREALACLVQDGLQLYAGAELILANSTVDALFLYPQLCLGESQYFLFELLPDMPPQLVPSVMFKASLKGFLPVFAHPERCLQIWDDESILSKIVDQGVLLQLTSGSLLGNFGRTAKNNAEKILKKFSSFVVLATDAHNTTARSPELAAGYAALGKISRQARQAAEKNMNCIMSAVLEVRNSHAVSTYAD